MAKQNGRYRLILGEVKTSFHRKKMEEQLIGQGKKARFDLMMDLITDVYNVKKVEYNEDLRESLSGIAKRD